jgi:hypothetical protein
MAKRSLPTHTTAGGGVSNNTNAGGTGSTPFAFAFFAPSALAGTSFGTPPSFPITRNARYQDDHPFVSFFLSHEKFFNYSSSVGREDCVGGLGAATSEMRMGG